MLTSRCTGIGVQTPFHERFTLAGSAESYRACSRLVAVGRSDKAVRRNIDARMIRNGL
jgi:hypothetical protein